MSAMPIVPNLTPFLSNFLAYLIELFLNGLATLVFAPKPSVSYGKAKHNES